MARPREFDTDQAIQKAMNVFWRLGYEGATLPDLLTEMGLTRGSLYKAFTDKKTLFLIVLDRYEQQIVAAAVALLSDHDTVDGWDRISKLFDQVADEFNHENRLGCLVCSSAAGPATYDTEIATVVNRCLDKLRAAFRIALDASRAHVSLSPQARQTLAMLLTTQYVGMRVIARAKRPIVGYHDSVASIQHLAGATR